MIGINENQQILDLPGQPSLVRLIRPSPEGFDSRMRLPRLSQHLLEVVLPEILQHKVRLVRVLDLAKLNRIVDVYELPPHRLVFHEEPRRWTCLQPTWRPYRHISLGRRCL